MGRLPARTMVLVAATVAVGIAADPAAARPSCAAPAPAAPAAAAAPPLRFGIYPGGPAGAVGATAAPVPEDPVRRLAAVQGLRAPGAPLLVRLYAGWTGDARADDTSAWLDGWVRDFTAAGLQVELAVRYTPARPTRGSPQAFARHLRGVVRRFGADRGVVALQVANEANLPGAPGASDGAFAGAARALVAGVVAAKDEVRRRGHAQLRIGFNWAYDERPAAASGFWSALGRLGGRRFAAAVDWVGLNSYPGTWTPRLAAGPGLPAQAAAAIRSALATLRGCHLPRAGLGRSVALRVTETGFPTGAGRDEALQARVLEALVRAVDGVRGSLGVTDLCWFDLRDGATADASMESHYGLMDDRYAPKPAYAVLKALVAELGAKAGPPVPVPLPLPGLP